MSNIELTSKQQRVLAYIEQQLAQVGRPPSLREISEYLGLATHSSAQAYIDALVRKGLIERLPQHRGLRLTAAARPAHGGQRYAGDDAGDVPSLGLPLVGRVAAGSPILAVENVESREPVDPAMFHPRADFLLRVRGESMRDAGILDGDLLAVQIGRAHV